MSAAVMLSDAARDLANCRVACPTGAIRFALAPSGARPRIEPAACSGYDECALVCPVNAIALDVTCQTEAPDA